MHITAIVGDYTFSKSFSDASDKLKEMFKGEVELTYQFCLRHQPFSKKQLDQMEENVSKADVIIVNMVFDDVVLAILEKYHNKEKSFIVLASVPRGIKLTKLGKFKLGELVDAVAESKIMKVLSVLKGLMVSSKSPMEVRKLLEISDVFLKVLRFGKWKDAGNYVRLWKYFYKGGRENIINMLYFIMAEYYGYKVSYKDPVEVPPTAIYHPKAQDFFLSLDEYLKWYDKTNLVKNNGWKKRPLIGILFYLQRYQSEDIKDLNMVIEKLEEKGVRVVTVLSEGSENVRNIKRHFINEKGPTVDAIISFLFFRIEGGPLGGDYEGFVNLCKKMNIPFIHYLCMGYTTIDEWKEKPEGMAPLETTITVILPELDGLIEGLLVAGHRDISTGKNIVRIMEPIEDRVDKAVARTVNWIKLRHKQNKDKKVAIVLFNYPPGKDNLGSAGNLDTFESIIRLLDKMKDDGYVVSGYPRTRHEFIRLVTKKNIINQSNWTALQKVKENSFKVSLDDYKKWFENVPKSCQDEMIGAWGDPPGKIMCDDKNIFVPGIAFGNVFVGFQPPRGYFEDPSKTYHDQAIVPHHQYLAFYRWIEDTFRADAILHFGTHGTLEFLPGKHVAMSKTCYPDILIGNLPNLYFYTCSNPSESSIAKRRIYATTVDYMTPPMIISDLYGKYAELEMDIHNFFQQKEQSPAQAKKIKEGILDKAKEANMVDVEAADVDINKLYDSLNEMKGSMMTKGVHVLGDSLNGEELINYVLGVVRFDRGDMVSLHKMIAASRGIDWDEARTTPSKITKGGKLMGAVLDEIDKDARSILSLVIQNNSPVKKLIKKNVKFKLKTEHAEEFEKTLEFAKTFAKSLSSNKEGEALIEAMKGSYIPPGLGGDPIRSPSVVPTGRNIYQFNPDLIPTPLACERGEAIADQVIENYKAENDNNLPETVAVILWGFETMKTQGETVAEIFRLLGVKPRWSGVGGFVGVSPIPLKELGRPRVDVVVEICGIFRDTFPLLLRMIDRAFKIVASLDEPSGQNFMRKHSLEIQKVLEGKGVPKEQAESLAQARIFGPSSSNYGTDVTQIIETSEWEDESQIADLHISKMAHIYGDKFHAFSSVDTFKEVLDKVDVVAQVRSSEEYGMADLDHYYEFLGGLSKSVETVRKKNPGRGKTMPTILVADSTRDKIKTKSIRSTLDYEAKTKLLNPEWIKGQIDSGYKGIRNIGQRVEHLLGWSVTAGSVDNWVWSGVAEKYMFDDEVRKKMMQENIWAVEHSLNRLMEAYNRGKWEASPEELEKLKQIYLEIESQIEEQEE
ncbi:MAG: magnesium chelatase subunit H [Candidatus Schekmanbacteria bacterium RIFCSPHIGHO2_02_FULL_38_11]|uniref:magnesium chelatase n=1 Tax=Candidatus Schekmanbacteria bacterium RIFCSPLOWO2_12_FULL_38_15 TaxID=1817883 RepID=A0A1F7SCJ7_9BACT|nr:MAG: magnesium chelatase subunit H [Candidatus Schekmanbacteria bacterium GWA2_38_9]OGL51441.1 MAG: magnesium chelatase subunit H [Candidatus Schekmanbacteria bacterium RIFCSPLOWO2_12_FULL_38_15]OGL51552.1 MAG: magnesium chelatase subunit H [Candidatus Schekmanbacteria bacterium RIFCSPLOWO2_02_FULL_38_14]OGL53177.1 MAG: magnesium chelatase subunit H [Candidatus Schekmanbacteria bacterium RIFCSPHIGHO2_02_FULL_38_11]